MKDTKIIMGVMNVMNEKKYQFINKENSKIVKLDSQGNEKKDSFTQSEIKRFPKKRKIITRKCR